MADQPHTTEKHFIEEKGISPNADSNSQQKNAFSQFADEKDMLDCWKCLALMEPSHYLSTDRLKVLQILKVLKIRRNLKYPELANESDNQKGKRIKRVVGLQEAMKELLLEDLNDPNEREDVKFFEALSLIFIPKDHYLRPRTAYFCSVDKRVVPVAPKLQPQTPDCKRENNRNGGEDAKELKWLGIQVWPPPQEGLEVIEEDIGKGRSEGCSCKNTGSIKCRRLHISEARARLQSQLGQAFFTWRFYETAKTFSEILKEEE
ncbi:hypothetical protein L6164_002199 [Bauhinia variegata]|uniref:Uncharacterized protein n=1 Tax=Bauhinia variegata TaxID=167791 RepID=A0ACB9PWN0_BAUVA|nr:hypothetical protein L6164_002199 [Bauhinia variegata]